MRRGRASWSSSCARASPPQSAYFWATHAGAELDLYFVRGGKRIGVEIKRTDAPALTKSMTIALSDLKLDKLFVIHAGTERFRLHEKVEALPYTSSTPCDRSGRLYCFTAGNRLRSTEGSRSSARWFDAHTGRRRIRRGPFGRHVRSKDYASRNMMLIALSDETKAHLGHLATVRGVDGDAP